MWRERSALTQLIQAQDLGKGQEEPVYAMTAASHWLPDWGTTYAEVDLTGQHVYMFQEGNLVWDAPCVTGNIAKNYNTPGIYSLTYKEMDRILRGAKKADGTYEYESHVDYWMPFNGGIGSMTPTGEANSAAPSSRQRKPWLHQPAPGKSQGTLWTGL